MIWNFQIVIVGEYEIPCYDNLNHELKLTWYCMSKRWLHLTISYHDMISHDQMPIKIYSSISKKNNYQVNAHPLKKGLGYKINTTFHFCPFSYSQTLLETAFKVKLINMNNQLSWNYHQKVLMRRVSNNSLELWTIHLF